MPDPVTSAPLAAAVHGRDAALRRAAEELEATFLAEMLKSAGLGRERQGFGGGSGEAQFASMLVDEQARAITARGGLGLAERIFESLKERETHD